MSVSPVVSVPLVALVICAAASGLGLAVNAVRPGGIPLVAPFPYEQDCPDKTIVEGDAIAVQRALALPASQRLFVDARPEEAFRAGHIPGARSVPFSFLTPVDRTTAAELGRRPHTIVYCDSPGDRLAGLLAQQLRDAGLKRVLVLQGGWDAYRAAAARPTQPGAR